MMTMTAFLGAIELGTIYAVLALGIFLSFRTLNMPDLYCGRFYRYRNGDISGHVLGRGGSISEPFGCSGHRCHSRTDNRDTSYKIEDTGHTGRDTRNAGVLFHKPTHHGQDAQCAFDTEPDHI